MGFSLFFLTLIGEIHYAEPWEAPKATEATYERKEPSTLSSFAQRAILFYRTHLTQTTGPRSHFRPSSSLYTLEAIQKHGFIKGYFMGCDRLLRENGEPWIYSSIIDEGRRYKAENP